MRLLPILLWLCACAGTAGDVVRDTDLAPDTDVASVDWVIDGPDALEAARGVTHVRGSLLIDASAVPDVDALSMLQSVDGDVVVTGGTLLANLDGLASLTTIGGDLRLTDAASLTSLDGLTGLVSIGGAWTVQGLASLASVGGVDHLATVGGRVSWIDLPALPTLACAPTLSAIHGLHVEGLPLLATLDGPGAPLTLDGDLLVRDCGVDGLPVLHGLASVGGTLQLAHLPTLTDLSGLAGVTSIGGDLVIDDMPVLGSLIGLDALERVDGWLTLDTAPLMTDVSSLSSLSTVQGIVVQSLPQLTAIDGWNSLTNVPGTFRLSHLTALTALVVPSLRKVGELIVDDDTALTTLSDLGPLKSAHGIGLYGDAGLKRFGWNGGDVKVDGWLAFEHNGLRTLNDVHFVGALGDVAPEAAGATLVITRNNQMVDVYGLSGITSAVGGVTLRDVDQAISLHGLDALTTCGPLEVSGSALLTDLDAFAALRTVTGPIVVSGNPRLSDVSGLDGLTSADRVSLADLPALCSTNVDALRAALPSIPVDATRVDCPAP